MTMDKLQELRNNYLIWLHKQLQDEWTPTGSYWSLVNIMFDKEFTWSVDHDDNRIVDALDLRIEYCNETRCRRTQMALLGPCSFLEVLIALSRHLAFVAGGEPPGWAWQLVTNLELHKCKDPMSPRRIRAINRILDTCIQRTYSPDGQGGFFPLAWPDGDQTQIELWYQLNAYAAELHPEH